MKKIFLICLTAGFISTGMAQSSVSDVPQNKIKPAYETAPAAKQQAAATQKAVTPQLVLNSVGLNAHEQPNVQPASVATKPVEITNVQPTAPSRLVSISATKADMPASSSVGASKNAASEAKTSIASPAQNKMPEPKISQDVQKADGPSSVDPAPVKKAAVTKQGEN